MNRVIKFRAWTKSRMLYRDLFDRNWYNEEDKQVYPAMPEDRTSMKVMQFTGLTDKNGKEIYEGDIVKIHGEVITTVVYGSNFDYPAFHYDPCNCEETNELQQDVINGEIEVIGNIYENKELLND